LRLYRNPTNTGQCWVAKKTATQPTYRCFTPNNPPPGQDEAAAVEAMTTFSKESLANLKKRAEGH
jgi:hypothetical protein